MVDKQMVEVTKEDAELIEKVKKIKELKGELEELTKEISIIEQNRHDKLEQINKLKVDIDIWQ